MNKFLGHYLLFFMLCFGSITTMYAQTENCSDGIDNDGDGLIDEYDPDCCNNPALDAFYDPCTSSDCTFQGSLDDVDLDPLFVSTENDYRTFCVPVFGDIDGDGHTEILVDRYNQTTNAIDIIDGVTHQVEETINISTFGFNTATAIAIGDILDANGDAGQDGQAEIVVSMGTGTILILRRIGGSYAVHRTINNVVNGGDPSTTNYTIAPNITDFDQDGIAEIHCGYFIIDPATGVLMNTLKPTTGIGAVATSSTNRDGILYMVAADVDGNRNLELVGGNSVYEVTIDRSIPTLPEATLSLIRNVPSLLDGYTAIADWDNDGDLDAIVTTINGANSQLYAWDLQSSTILGNVNIVRPISTTTNPYNTASVGRANIGDLDGDGFVEAVFCHNYSLVAIDNDFTQQWNLPTTDESGLTGITMFDFDGNGTTEVVYRDETDIRILDGGTGTNIESRPCFSSTALEYPTVGDIDNNGTTELLTICDTDSIDNRRGLAGFLTVEGRLTVFQPTNTAWIPSRGVWNQNNYFYTNINDDLTIPMIQQNPHLPGDLNMFNNQYADLLARVPDATGELEEAYCNLSGEFITINLDISNIGDRLLSSSMPISIYSSNPFTANSLNPAILLGTVTPLTANLGVGNSTIISITIPAVNYAAEYFILLNDNGSNAANPNNFPYNPNNPYASNIAECNYLNNLIAVDHPSCCFAEASPDYTKMEPAQGSSTFTISGYHEIWPDKVYIPDGVTVVVENSAILDITNSDVVFGTDAKIEVTEDAQLLAYNSVFRPCDDSETWEGIVFKNTITGAEGSIKECTFINAEVAIAIEQVDLVKRLAEVEFKNNLFTNCYVGLRINYKIGEPNIQVSGNTFEWGDWEHISYNKLPGVIEFLGIELIHTGATPTRYFHPITQNSFVNNTNYNSTVLGHTVGGMFVQVGNADMDASNNQFTNLDYAFRAIANSAAGNPKISFENNFIEITRRSNKKLNYQIEITRQETNFSSVAFISGNTIVNSAVVDATSLVPTNPLINQTLVGTGAIYSNNSAHIVDNYIRGFEVGIFADGSGLGTGTQPARISNNKIESFVYGIYRRGFANLIHTVITCNEINMKQIQDKRSVNSVGICYHVDVPATDNVKTPDYMNPSLGYISNNCVSNTDMAIQIVNSSQVGGGNRLPPSLRIENNFLQNYHRIGLDIYNFEHVAANGEFIRRNTFFSNNKLSSVTDIGRTIGFAAALGTTFDIHGNDYGSTAVTWSNVSILSNNVEPSSATCAGQDAGSESGLIFVDCNDEDILGETLTPTELGNLNGGIGATTNPSNLPFPVLGEYTTQTMRDADLEANDLYVFPNPTANELTISFDNLLKGAKVLKVYNAQGQLVKMLEFSDTPVQKTISVETLAVGVYEVVLMDSRGLAGTSKFVKK